MRCSEWDEGSGAWRFAYAPYGAGARAARGGAWRCAYAPYGAVVRRAHKRSAMRRLPHRRQASRRRAASAMSVSGPQ
jgi:hypothetical protein